MGRTADAGGRRRVDPRLLIGIGLVAASVAGTGGLVAAVDTRRTVLAAASALAPGDRVERDDLVERSVALDGAEGLYLAPRDLPADGFVVVEAVQRGELVPRSAVADSDAHRSTVLVIESVTPVASGVRVGSPIEVWASAVDDGSRAGAPTVLVPEGVVTRVIPADGLMSAASGGAVEVRVPRSRVAGILQAQANGDLLAVVPAGLPLGD